MLVAYLLVGMFCYSYGSGALFSDGDGNPMTGGDVLAEATLEGVTLGTTGIELGLAPRVSP